MPSFRRPKSAAARVKGSPLARFAARLAGAGAQRTKPGAHAGHLLDDPGERLRFSASLPGLMGGGALLKIAVEAHSEPDALGGERLRLRAHLEANLASAVRPALAALAMQAARLAEGLPLASKGEFAGALRAYDDKLAGAATVDAAQADAARAPATSRRDETRSDATAKDARVVAPASSMFPTAVPTAFAPLATGMAMVLAPLRARATHWLAARAGEWLPAVQQGLDPFLRRDHQTWVELHASTAPLDQGAASLLPNAKGLEKLGIRPVEGPEATPLQAWNGTVGGESAQVALLRLDDKLLPDELRARLGGKPLSLAAAVVSLARTPPKA